MARSFHNIDTPWCRGAPYVGYASGEVFHITKVYLSPTRKFRWRACQVNGFYVLWGDTLEDISTKLESLAAKLAAKAA